MWKCRHRATDLTIYLLLVHQNFQNSMDAEGFFYILFNRYLFNFNIDMCLEFFHFKVGILLIQKLNVLFVLNQFLK